LKNQQGPFTVPHFFVVACVKHLLRSIWTVIFLFSRGKNGGCHLLLTLLNEGKKRKMLRRAAQQRSAVSDSSSHGNNNNNTATSSARRRRHGKSIPAHIFFLPLSEERKLWINTFFWEDFVILRLAAGISTLIESSITLISWQLIGFLLICGRILDLIDFCSKDVWKTVLIANEWKLSELNPINRNRVIENLRKVPRKALIMVKLRTSNFKKSWRSNAWPYGLMLKRLLIKYHFGYKMVFVWTKSVNKQANYFKFTKGPSN
jgi:hypothetical protein